MRFSRDGKKRTGAIIVLSAVMMLFLVGMLAFAVDLGYINMVEAEMARASDAGALAGAWELLDQAQTPGMNMGYNYYDAYEVYGTAAQYVALNPVANDSAAVTWGDWVALEDRDIQIGYLADPWDSSAALDFTDPNLYNAVRVRVRQTAQQNGETPLAFASVLGISSAAQQGEATAVFLNGISGFQTPASGQNPNVMPFALDKQTWDAMLAGGGGDDWGWDEWTNTLYAGADGYREVNLFPQGAGSPGNRGTVDIGSANNSTADLSRQILNGPTAADLAYHGGIIALDVNGELDLNGDTGISAGMKDELASIIGETRVILLFDTVAGNGNNATYTIVGFAGVRVLEVKLTGSLSSKRVVVQPARALTTGGVPTTGSGPTSSYNVYSSPWIIR